MADIFISYARKDRARAKVLIRALKADGWTTWWDILIPPGQLFDVVIEQKLNAAGCVIVLWSKNSVTNNWVRVEADAAFARGVLVPVFIDAVTLPLRFRLTQAASLVSWAGDRNAAEYARLKTAITAVLGRQSVPTPPSSRLRKVLAAAGLSIVVAVGGWAVDYGSITAPKDRGITDLQQKPSVSALPRNPQVSPFASPAQQQYCCKTCAKGKACGNTCIPRDRTCHVGPGCACSD